MTVLGRRMGWLMGVSVSPGEGLAAPLLSLALGMAGSCLHWQLFLAGWLETLTYGSSMW